MVLPYIVLSVLVIMPYVIKGFALPQIVKEKGSYDNKNPRTQMAECKGMAARLTAAQNNAWEALIFYTACLFVAVQLKAGKELVNTVSLVFLIARILHAVSYAKDWDKLRSFAFFVAFACGMAMLVGAFV